MNNEQPSSTQCKKEPDIHFRFNMKDIEKQIRKAFEKAFK